MQKKKLFILLFIINFAVTFSYGIFDSFFSLFLLSTGIKVSMLGIPMAVYALSKIILSVPAGRVSDKISSRKVLISAIAFYTLIALLYLCSTNIITIIFLRLLQGIASALLRPAMLSYINNIADDNNMASVASKFDISFYLALGLGPICGGIIRNYYGFYGLFVFMSAICSLILLISLLCIQENCSEVHNVCHKRENITINVFALMVFIFGRAIGISTVFAFLPILIEHNLHLESVQTGIVFTASTVSMTLLLRIFGRLGDIVPKIILIFTGGVSASLITAFLPFTSGFIGVVCLSVILGVFGAMSQPPSVAMLIEEGEKCGIGKASGYFNFSMNTGFALGPVIGSVAMVNYGINSVFYVAGCLGVLFTLLFLFISSGVKGGIAVMQER